MRCLGVAVFCLVVSLGVCASAFADGQAVYRTCAGCHGADGSTHAMGVSPVLKGQSAEELLEKLKGYADGSYGGAKKMIMANTLKRLTPEQMAEVAEYAAGFGGK